MTMAVVTRSVIPGPCRGYSPHMSHSEPSLERLLTWRGRSVVDRDGEKVGSVGALYLDGASDRPTYAGLRTGLFGRHESIVPLDRVTEEGDRLRVPYDLAAVRDAPKLDPDAVLTPEEEDALREHYRDAPRTETEMVRSEEEVTQHVEPMQPTERVRMRKVLVTEDVETTVPVRREVVQLETEPPPAGRIESVEDVDAGD